MDRLSSWGLQSDYWDSNGWREFQLLILPTQISQDLLTGIHTLQSKGDRKEEEVWAPAASRLAGNRGSPAPHTSLSMQIQVIFLATKGKFWPGYRTQDTCLLTTQNGHGRGLLITQGTIAGKGCLTYRIQDWTRGNWAALKMPRLVPVTRVLRYSLWDDEL